MPGVAHIGLADAKLRKPIGPDFIAEWAEVELEKVQPTAKLEIVFAARPGDTILKVVVVIAFVAEIGVGDVAESLSVECDRRKSTAERPGTFKPMS